MGAYTSVCRVAALFETILHQEVCLTKNSVSFSDSLCVNRQVAVQTRDRNHCVMGSISAVYQGNRTCDCSIVERRVLSSRRAVRMRRLGTYPPPPWCEHHFQHAIVCRYGLPWYRGAAPSIGTRNDFTLCLFVVSLTPSCIADWLQREQTPGRFSEYNNYIKLISNEGCDREHCRHGAAQCISRINTRSFRLMYDLERLFHDRECNIRFIKRKTISRQQAVWCNPQPIPLFRASTLTPMAFANILRSASGLVFWKKAAYQWSNSAERILTRSPSDNLTR